MTSAVTVRVMEITVKLIPSDPNFPLGKHYSYTKIINYINTKIFFKYPA